MTSIVKCVYSTLQTQLLVAGTACGNNMWRHSSSGTRAAVENIKYTADVHLLKFNVQEYLAVSSTVGVLFRFCVTSCMRTLYDHPL